jgi:hypothetical protein
MFWSQLMHDYGLPVVFLFYKGLAEVDGDFIKKKSYPT